MTYDMSDDLIREMVERNHEPEEYVVRQYSGARVDTLIRCCSCEQSWPCRAINQLREWKTREMERQVQARNDAHNWLWGGSNVKA